VNDGMLTFMTLFKALLDYHQTTRHLDGCRPMGDEVEALLVNWDETYGKRT
jgi:hypothetical protein